MQKISIWPSRSLLLSWVILSLALAHICFYLESGLGAAILFALAGLAIAFECLHFKPLITIDEKGIYDRKMGVGLIPWEDIKSVRMQKLGFGHCVALEIKGCQKYRVRLPKWRQSIGELGAKGGIPEFHLSTMASTSSAETLHKLILQRTQDHYSEMQKQA